MGRTAAVIRPYIEPGRRVIAISDIHGNLPFFEGLMEMEAEGLLTADLVRRFRRSLCEDEAWEPFVGVKLYVLDLFLETLSE